MNSDKNQNQNSNSSPVEQFTSEDLKSMIQSLAFTVAQQNEQIKEQSARNAEMLAILASLTSGKQATVNNSATKAGSSIEPGAETATRNTESHSDDSDKNTNGSSNNSDSNQTEIQSKEETKSNNDKDSSEGNSEPKEDSNHSIETEQDASDINIEVGVSASKSASLEENSQSETNKVDYNVNIFTDDIDYTKTLKMAAEVDAIWSMEEVVVEDLKDPKEKAKDKKKSDEIKKKKKEILVAANTTTYCKIRRISAPNRTSIIKNVSSYRATFDLDHSFGHFVSKDGIVVPNYFSSCFYVPNSIYLNDNTKKETTDAFVSENSNGINNQGLKHRIGKINVNNIYRIQYDYHKHLLYLNCPTGDSYNCFNYGENVLVKQYEPSKKEDTVQKYRILTCNYDVSNLAIGRGIEYPSYVLEFDGKIRSLNSRLLSPCMLEADTMIVDCGISILLRYILNSTCQLVKALYQGFLQCGLPVFMIDTFLDCNDQVFTILDKYLHPNCNLAHFNGDNVTYSTLKQRYDLLKGFLLPLKYKEIHLNDLENLRKKNQVKSALNVISCLNSSLGQSLFAVLMTKRLPITCASDYPEKIVEWVNGCDFIGYPKLIESITDLWAKALTELFTPSFVKYVTESVVQDANFLLYWM